MGELSSVTSIGEYAFDGCSLLVSVGDLSSVTSIGGLAFYGCSSLASVGDLRSVTEIGNYAFDACSNLTLRVLPNSYAENYAKSNNIKYTYIED